MTGTGAVRARRFVHRQDPRLYEETMDRASNATAAHPLMTQVGNGKRPEGLWPFEDLN